MSLVLLVEDESALLDLYADVVADLGFEVLLAHDGEEALELARARRPTLIVSDHMMPRRTGLELLRAVRADHALAETPFVLISAALPREAGEADAVLAKPVPLEVLERTVRAAARSEEAAAPGPATAVEAPGETGDELLARIAHEVRTPLASARMILELLARHLGRTDPAAGERVAAALAQLDRIETAVRLELAPDARRDREPVVG